MSRLLVLVLSCRKPPYDALWEAQQRTWDSVSVPDVSTLYYWCDELATMPWRLKLALDSAWDARWDMIFRTNSSSYADKERLLAHAATLPAERCYQGVEGIGFASGSGFFLSRDLAMILRLYLENRNYDAIEDEVVGQVLRDQGIHNIPGAERIDYWPRPTLVRTQRSPHDASRIFEPINATRGATENDVRDTYHVRCKASDGDRQKDVEAMEIVHRLKAVV